jgi:hypothetical protein
MRVFVLGAGASIHAGARNKSSACSIHSKHAVPDACATKGRIIFRLRGDGN